MRVRLLLVAAVLGAVLTGQAAVPPTVFACSCALIPLADLATDEHHVVFSGEVASVGPGGVEVRVDRWYKGEVSPAVVLDPAGFGGNGAGCEASWPTVGSRWIWAAYKEQPDSLPSVGLCSPSSLLGTESGDRMEAEARAAFGEGRPAVAPPEEPAPAVTGPPLGGVGPAVVFGGVGLAVVVLFAGAALLARRGRGSDGSA